MWSGQRRPLTSPRDRMGTPSVGLSMQSATSVRYHRAQTERISDDASEPAAPQRALSRAADERRGVGRGLRVRRVRTKRGVDQTRAASEVVVEEAGGDPGRSGDFLDAKSTGSAPGNRASGGCPDLVPRFEGVAPEMGTFARGRLGRHGSDYGSASDVAVGGPAGACAGEARDLAHYPTIAKPSLRGSLAAE